MTRRRWKALVGFVVAAWVIAVGFLLVQSALDLRTARNKAQEARDHLDAASVADGSALPELREARDKFRSAADAAGNPLVTPLRFVPVLGRQVRAVHAMSRAAADVSDAGTVALERAHEILRDRAADPAARVRQIRALTTAVNEAAEAVHRVDDLGPRRALIGPVRTAHNELAEKLADVRETLDDAAAGTRAAQQLVVGPRRYLLVTANPAEMRAGTGMWLSGGVLTTEQGSFDLAEVSPLYEQANPRQPIPIGDADLAARWGELWNASNDWRALMTSPRLSASAELGRQMWLSAGQPDIDGILVVDPVALAAIVRATGPVQASGRTLAAKDVIPFLMNGQYQSAGHTERRSALSTLSSAAVDALDQREWSATTLAKGLGDAIAGRHLMAWSRHELEQEAWVSAGMAGELRSDSLAVSVMNRGANKLDWFLHADATIASKRAGDGRDVTVRVRLDNTTPDGQVPYVSGRPVVANWTYGLYVGVIAVNLPPDATDIQIDDRPIVTEGSDGPTKVAAAELRVRQGEVLDVMVRFHLPGDGRLLRIEPSARIPGVRWHHGTRSWEDSRSRTVNLG